jgi:hypothetical protein
MDGIMFVQLLLNLIIIGGLSRLLGYSGSLPAAVCPVTSKDRPQRIVG